MTDNADLRLEMQKEVDRLAAECKASGFDNAARYLADNRTAIVEIAHKGAFGAQETRSAFTLRLLHAVGCLSAHLLVRSDFAKDELGIAFSCGCGRPARAP